MEDITNKPTVHILQHRANLSHRWMSLCAKWFSGSDDSVAECDPDDIEQCTCTECLEVIVTTGSAAESRLAQLLKECNDN